MTMHSTVAIKLKKQHPLLESTHHLNVIDFLNCNLETTFIYLFKNNTKRPLNLKKLQTSLQETVQEYPELTAALAIDDGIALNFNNSGLSFITSEKNVTYYDVLSMKNEQLKCFLATDSTINPSSYLCYVKVTKLVDGSFTIGISMNHSLQDAHGMFRFMNAWSHNFVHEEADCGNYTSHDVKDRLLLTGKDVLPVINSRTSYILRECNYWDNPFLNVVEFQFEVSKTKLKYWKERYLQYRSEDDPLFVSSHDLLMAIYFQASLRARRTPIHEEVYCAQVVNFRSRVGISHKYTGNCVLPMFLKNTVINFLEMDVCTLACLIRKELNAIDDKLFRSTLSVLESQTKWKVCTNFFDLSKDIFFISWESFPIFNVTFGHGEQPKFLCPQKSYGLPITFPHHNVDLILLSGMLLKDEIGVVLNDKNLQSIIVNVVETG